jgi:hypothetical protein
MNPCRRKKAMSFRKLTKPLRNIFSEITPLLSRGNMKLRMTFEDQLNALIHFHPEDHDSGRDLIKVRKEDNFVREYIAPDGGIEKSSFFEAINSRGLEQLMEVFQSLQCQARGILPKEQEKLGDLVSVDGSLINATLSVKPVHTIKNISYQWKRR